MATIIDRQNNHAKPNCLRHSGIDRRSNSFRTAIYSCYSNRRTTLRRTNEHEFGRYYVDVHESRLFFIALSALLLCTADAFFTMILLNFYGSEELNPLMKYFIEKDVQLFFMVKFSLTAFCVFFLVMHKNFRLFNCISGYQILYGSLALYVILVLYELTLLIIVPMFRNGHVVTFLVGA
ncbi:MAG: hypothetical protein GXP08_00370 [Gammaproteobacteria bacterium]|nr:hypothetical protein [Gammaproteobacteria bacterium]